MSRRALSLFQLSRDFHRRSCRISSLGSPYGTAGCAWCRPALAQTRTDPAHSAPVTATQQKPIMTLRIDPFSLISHALFVLCLSVSYPTLCHHKHAPPTSPVLTTSSLTTTPLPALLPYSSVPVEGGTMTG
ncbi:hypothetical protein E2C01_088873 [Portunus trituberculatus]|uniref:Uncharacterized protein n=1 Tax=Portunus trituberculatus TaxID=210409 RepID=A0A5B7JH87_PORTR|nr:hypothetical protein [Portunus trituberculatus]